MLTQLRIWAHRTYIKWVNGGDLVLTFKSTLEDEILDRFRENPRPGYAELIAFMAVHGDFRRLDSELFISRSGRITAFMGAMGLDIHIDLGPLLDLHPEHYGLTRDQAYELYDGIAANVPGSIHYYHRKKEMAYA